MPFHPVHSHYGVGDWWWSTFSTLLFVALIVGLVVVLARAFSGPRRGGAGGAGAVGRRVAGPWYGPPGGRHPGSAPEGAERILAERYARGEISEEEYRARLEVLREASGAGAGWASRPAPPSGPPPSAPPPSAPLQNAALRQQGATPPQSATPPQGVPPSPGGHQPTTPTPSQTEPPPGA
jgi:putative membrane protein